MTTQQTTRYARDAAHEAKIDKMAREIVKRDAPHNAAVRRVFNPTVSGTSGLRGINADFAEELRTSGTLENFDRIQRERRHNGMDVEHRNRAFERYLTRGDFEQRDQGYTTGSAGGYLVAPAFYPEVVFSTQYASAIASRSRVWESPTGAPASFVTALSENNVVPGTQAEDVLITGGGDIVFGRTSFTETLPTIASEMNKISRQLFYDADSIGVDVKRLVLDAYAQRMGRSVDKLAMTTAVAGASVTTTTASPTALTLDDLNAALFTLTATNRNAPNSAIIVAPSTALALRSLKDTAGRPLLLDATMQVVTDDFTMYGDAPLTRTLRFMSYAGLPVLESVNGVQAVGATNVVALVGNFEAFGVLRVVSDSIAVMWSWERGAEYGLAYSIGFGRFDYGVADTGAVVKVLAHA